MPPVSTSSKKRPPDSTTVATRSRVTPAVGSTMLIRRPASQLKSDDLPTFGRPTIATSGIDTVNAPTDGDGRPRVPGRRGVGLQPLNYGTVTSARDLWHLALARDPH